MHASAACKSTSALIAAIVLAALTATAHADVIGINFVGANNGAPAGGVSVSGPAGSVPQSDWNNDTTSISSALMFSDGSPSGALVSYHANDSWSTGKSGTTQNGDLLQGYLDDLATNPTTVTVTNLPSSIAGTGSTPYNVYIYIAGDTANRGGTYTVNNTTVTLLNSGPQPDGTLLLASPGADDGTGATLGNYYEFTGVTGTTLSISTTPTIDNTGIGANKRTPINAIQIVTAPEPASLAMLTLAALPLLARRRRIGG